MRSSGIQTTKVTSLQVAGGIFGLLMRNHLEIANEAVFALLNISVFRDLSEENPNEHPGPAVGTSLRATRSARVRPECDGPLGALQTAVGRQCVLPKLPHHHSVLEIHHTGKFGH